MDNPLVSILIPAYNVEKYISQCLDSVINQTYRNLQIIIVDDGSKDLTGKICDEYAEKDKRIEVYHIPNGGVANARNVLLSKIKGDYFLFVDSDDWIEADTIKFLVNIALKNNADVAVCRIVIAKNLPPVDKISYVYHEESYNKDSFIAEYLRHNKVSGSLCNKLIKASLIGDNNFRLDISYGEDSLLFWKLLSNVEKVVVTNVPKYFYRRNNSSLSYRKWTPEGKGSGKMVWDAIRKDVIKKYPAYMGLVNARCSLQNMWDLIFASRSNYPKDEHIRERQRFINAHMRDLRRFKLAGVKQYLAAVVLGRWYGAGKIINKFM